MMRTIFAKLLDFMIDSILEICRASNMFIASKSSLRVPRAETWLTVYRPLHVTRREGTSKSNSVDARGDFASKLVMTQM